MNSNHGSCPVQTPYGWLPRAELHVLMLPDLERVEIDPVLLGNSATGTFGDLLIDCEEDRTLRAVLVGMLRKAER